MQTDRRTNADGKAKEAQPCHRVLYQVGPTRAEKGGARAVVLVVVGRPESARNKEISNPVWSSS